MCNETNGKGNCLGKEEERLAKVNSKEKYPAEPLRGLMIKGTKYSRWK